MREGTPKKGYLFYNVPRGTLLQLFSFISIIKTNIYFLDC